MKDKDTELKARAERLLEEALSGNSPRSKSSLIKEALKALREISATSPGAEQKELIGA